VTHICARGENEVVIVDIWETEDDLRSMQNNPEFLRNLEAAGFPLDPTETIYEVYATIPRAVALVRAGSARKREPAGPDGHRRAQRYATIPGHGGFHVEDLVKW
jgi:hypothetical protein